jgi:hypothetical protein
MALSNDQGKAAPSIAEMLAEIFEQTINPLLRRCVEAAISADARAEAAEARCARVEEALQSKSGLSEHELKRLEEMVNRSLERLKPTIDRSVKHMEETVRRNTLLAQACVALHDENVFLKSASISSIGKPS